MLIRTNSYSLKIAVFSSLEDPNFNIVLSFLIIQEESKASDYLCRLKR